MHRDVWNSVDGDTSVRVTAAASWASRGYHSSFEFENELWLVGGNKNSAAFSDIWTSADGATWQLENADAYWGQRMFDIDVKNSIMLDSFIMQVPPNFQSPPNITNDTFVKVYYKEGSYSNAMSNLSNCCLLGSANFAYRNTSWNTSIPVSNLTIAVPNLQHTQFEWLGSQWTWILNSSLYMSSAFDGIVNFSANFSVVLSPMWQRRRKQDLHEREFSKRLNYKRRLKRTNNIVTWC